MKNFYLLSVSLVLAAAGCVGAEDGEEDVGEVGVPDTMMGPVKHTVVDTEVGLRVVAYEVHDGRALIEGDINIGPADAMFEVAADADVKHLPARAWSGLFTTNWPSSTIFYEAPTLAELGTTSFNNFYNAIVEIQAETQLNFQLAYSGDRIRLRRSTDAGVSSSAVGRQGGAQTVRLATNASVRTIIHELLHAAGFYHEQSRSDRDDKVEINWACIPYERWHNFQKEAGVSPVTYDYGSIMHYSRTAFMIDSPSCTWTIRRKDGGLWPLWALLSPKDIETINVWY